MTTLIESLFFFFFKPTTTASLFNRYIEECKLRSFTVNTARLGSFALNLHQHNDNKIINCEKQKTLEIFKKYEKKTKSQFIRKKIS